MHADVIEAGRAYLAETFRHLGWAITVAATDEDEDGIQVLRLTGEIDGLRRQPQLVSALTLLTCQAMSRTADQPVRCALDVGGKLAERRALLETLARDVARAVGQTSQVAIIEGLSSGERRTVHTLLRDDRRVDTQGEGPAEARRLAVGPARPR